MLAEVKTPHADFAALCNYLLHGKPGSKHNPKRVAWAMTHNLHADIPEHAAKIMDATALLSPRIQKPTYHAMIAWHINETPTPEQMQHIAIRTLQMMDLEEHQALIVGHGDTSHRHLHMAINRVHPGTGRAWKTSHDYLRLDRVMKALAEEQGFTYVPSHRFNVGDAAVHQRTRGLTKATYNLAKRDGKKLLPQWSKAQSEAFGSRIQADMENARSWQDLDHLFRRHNLSLQTKGQGLVLMGDETYTKLSALGSFARARAFATRFGETFDDYTARSSGLEQLEPPDNKLDQPTPHPRHKKTSPAPPAPSNHPRRNLDPARMNTLAVEATQHFQNASSWTDLSARLAPMGIQLTPRGRGLIFTQGEYALSFRKLAPNHTMKELHQRFEETFYRYRRRVDQREFPRTDRPATRHHQAGQPLTIPPAHEGPLATPGGREAGMELRSSSNESTFTPSKLFLVDGVDITRALETLGLASREDVLEAIQNALKQQEDAKDAAASRAIGDIIGDALKPFLQHDKPHNKSQQYKEPEPPKPSAPPAKHHVSIEDEDEPEIPL